MSDDVFEAFGGDDIFNDDDEPKQAEGEGQNNRTFIMAVAVLGGLLVCAVGAFMVWALFLNTPRQMIEAPIEPPVVEVAEIDEVNEVNEVIVIVETETPLPTETPAPTDTPEPTPSPTPLLGPTSNPDSEGEAVAGGEGAESTQVVRRTAVPTATPPTLAQSTTGGAEVAVATGGATQLSQTGLGEWVLIGVAVLLLATMVLARRLRSA
jgi:hypothetical protein